MAVTGMMVSVLALSGCGNVRQTLGLDRSAPDEFAVLSRAPLSMPPDFKLRPPRPGTPRPQESSTRAEAQDLVYGSGGTARGRGGRSVTSGEQVLLGRVGADKAPADIRQRVDEETSAVITADRRWSESLLFWREYSPPTSIVDPLGEVQRLRENQATGRPVSAGDTPTIERKSKAALKGLVN